MALPALRSYDGRRDTEGEIGGLAMWEFLKQWNWHPGAIITLFVVIGGFLTAIVAIIANSWSRARREEIRANLKRDMLDRGVAAEQVERLINLPVDGKPEANEKELEGNLASVLVQNEIPAATLERVVRIYQETDPATKKAVYAALEEIIGCEPEEEQLLAAVRALCPARTPAVSTGRFQEVPAGVGAG
jgi:hypothetical protein